MNATLEEDEMDPNLATQLEDLVVTVMKCESEWSLDDRISLAVRLEGERRAVSARGERDAQSDRGTEET